MSPLFDAHGFCVGPLVLLRARGVSSLSRFLSLHPPHPNPPPLSSPPLSLPLFLSTRLFRARAISIRGWTIPKWGKCDGHSVLTSAAAWPLGGVLRLPSNREKSMLLYDGVKSCRSVNFTDSMTQPFHGSSASPWQQRSSSLGRGRRPPLRRR